MKNEKYEIKNTYPAGEADVAVIGAGHAGIEAALACARRMLYKPGGDPGPTVHYQP